MQDWEQECMGLHAQEMMAMQEPQLNINAHMHSLPGTHVCKVRAPCFLRIYMSCIAVSVIVKKYPRQQLNQSVTMLSVLKIFFKKLLDF